MSVPSGTVTRIPVFIFSGFRDYKKSEKLEDNMDLIYHNGNSDITLNQMYTFLVVAEYGNFTKASASSKVPIVLSKFQVKISLSKFKVPIEEL